MKTEELCPEKKNCCGCGACINICPQNAIRFNEDKDGFLYPEIDEDRCINCLKCKKICAFQNQKKNVSIKETYVAVSKNTNVLESASGGLFASYAVSVLENGGMVYGCAMLEKNGKLYPKHIGISKKSELWRLKGSKYVQSDMGTVYYDIRQQLENEITVLFSGTPCQVSSLKKYLGKEYTNLYTIDIICHGVPSIKLFQDYLAYTERKMQGRVTEFHFRDKTAGWKLYGQMTIQREDGQEKVVHFEPEKSSYYQMFLEMYTYRENCYNCPYASDNRPGDITIGDYWCIDLVHPELMHDNGGDIEPEKGVSCMIINNSHGQQLLKTYGKGIQRFKSSYEKAAKYNGQLSKPSTLKPERKKVFEIYRRDGYSALDSWYNRKMIPVRIGQKVRSSIPAPVKGMIKAVLRRGKVE